MSDGCNCRSAPLGRADSVPPNPLAAFKGPLRGGKRGERGSKERGGRKHPEINF